MISVFKLHIKIFSDDFAFCLMTCAVCTLHNKLVIKKKKILLALRKFFSPLWWGIFTQSRKELALIIYGWGIHQDNSIVPAAFSSETLFFQTSGALRAVCFTFSFWSMSWAVLTQVSFGLTRFYASHFLWFIKLHCKLGTNPTAMPQAIKIQQLSWAPNLDLKYTR